MIRKKLLTSLVVLFLFSSTFTAYAQETLTGRYVADDEDSLYEYFEFTSRNTVRIGMEIIGYNPRVTARYTIEDGYVIIEADGFVIELEIINANTLEDDDGVRFIKRSSSQR